MQCKWSGNITMAYRSNGRVIIIFLNAFLNIVIFSWELNMGLRWCVTSVKK